MQITKVKLIKGGETLELSTVKQEANRSTTKAKEEHSAAVHVDLKSAMLQLAIHFAILADYIKPSQVKAIKVPDEEMGVDVDELSYDPELIKGFNVTGYSLGGDEEDRGIIITGHKLKSNGKAIIINTPFTRFIEAEESMYQFIDHLEYKISKVEAEVQLYLQGKVAPEPQASFDFPDPPEEHTGNDAEDDTEDDHTDEINTVPADSKAKKKATGKKKTPAKKKAVVKKMEVVTEGE